MVPPRPCSSNTPGFCSAIVTAERAKNVFPLFLARCAAGHNIQIEAVEPLAVYVTLQLLGSWPRATGPSTRSLHRTLASMDNLGDAFAFVRGALEKVTKHAVVARVKRVVGGIPLRGAYLKDRGPPAAALYFRAASAGKGSLTMKCLQPSKLAPTNLDSHRWLRGPRNATGAALSRTVIISTFEKARKATNGSLLYRADVKTRGVPNFGALNISAQRQDTPWSPTAPYQAGAFDWAGAASRPHAGRVRRSKLFFEPTACLRPLARLDAFLSNLQSYLK